MRVIAAVMVIYLIWRLCNSCWMAKNRTADGKQIGDPTKFPSGMGALADHLHTLGLKFGLYSARCQFTCQGLPASFNFEAVDAAQYAAWKVDCTSNLCCPFHAI